MKPSPRAVVLLLLGAAPLGCGHDAAPDAREGGPADPGNGADARADEGPRPPGDAGAADSDAAGPDAGAPARDDRCGPGVYLGAGQTTRDLPSVALTALALNRRGQAMVTWGTQSVRFAPGSGWGAPESIPAGIVPGALELRLNDRGEALLLARDADRWFASVSGAGAGWQTLQPVVPLDWQLADVTWSNDGRGTLLSPRASFNRTVEGVVVERGAGGWRTAKRFPLGDESIYGGALANDGTAYFSGSTSYPDGDREDAWVDVVDPDATTPRRVLLAPERPIHVLTQVLVGRDGVPYASWKHGLTAQYSALVDGSWQTIETVPNHVDGGDDVGFWRINQAGAGGDLVFVGDTNPRELWIVRGKRGALRTPEKVSEAPKGDLARAAAVGVDAEGNIALVVAHGSYDDRGGPTHMDLFLVRFLVDRGWQPPESLAHLRSTIPQIPADTFAQVVPDEAGHWFVTWTQGPLVCGYVRDVADR